MWLDVHGLEGKGDVHLVAYRRAYIRRIHTQSIIPNVFRLPSGALMSTSTTYNRRRLRRADMGRRQHCPSFRIPFGCAVSGRCARNIHADALQQSFEELIYAGYNRHISSIIPDSHRMTGVLPMSASTPKHSTSLHTPNIRSIVHCLHVSGCPSDDQCLADEHIHPNNRGWLRQS